MEGHVWYWIPAPDGKHEAKLRLRGGGRGWELELPDGEVAPLPTAPQSPFDHAGAISAALDVLADRGLWKAGGQQYWRRHGEKPGAEPPPGLGPAVWRETRT